MRSKLKDPSVLVVEDNDEDFVAIQRVFGRMEEKIRLQRCVRAEEALELLDSLQVDSPAPASLVVLDLNLPGLSGRVVLNAIRNHPQYRSMPVVVFSTSSNPKDIHWCYENGANSYHVKSMDYVSFRETIQSLKGYWLNEVRLPTEPPAGGHVN